MKLNYYKHLYDCVVVNFFDRHVGFINEKIVAQDIKGRSGKMPALNDAGDGLRFEVNLWNGCNN